MTYAIIYYNIGECGRYKIKTKEDINFIDYYRKKYKNFIKKIEFIEGEYNGRSYNK